MQKPDLTLVSSLAFQSVEEAQQIVGSVQSWPEGQMWFALKAEEP
jgi:hypothetical protein